METPLRSGEDPAAYILKNPLVLFTLSLAGAALNMILSFLFRLVLRLPLFMDTLFTMALTFSGGLFWGTLTGVLSTFAYCFINGMAWTEYLYALCNVAIALITALFIRLFPGELGFPVRRTILDRVIVLIILSFILSIVISLMGGIIAAYIPLYEGAQIPFRLELVRRGFSRVGVEVLARIPLNIIDRLISAFGAYGAALLVWKAVLLVRRFRNTPL
jgi:hypothetical protein